MKQLGLIVNPMAGIGGKVGLKGSDGDHIRSLALSLGARPEAPDKVIKALKLMKERNNEIQIIPCPGAMGEDEARAAGYDPIVLDGISTGNTSAADTQAAAAMLRAKSVDLIMFAGGDGTARDVCSVIGTGTPVLGIPAGVKIHSGVYGASPYRAGEAAAMYLGGSASMTLKDMEVMDIDEDAFREDRVSAKLYGYMTVPYERKLLQCAKAGSSMSERATIQSIASDIVSRMKEDEYYIIGPGSTTRGILEIQNLPATLLGVDVIRNGELVMQDANETDLIKLLEGDAKGRAHIIVTVIGGQGYVFGRGNQQLSARVIELVGKKNIDIVATEAKMIELDGKPLLVDTGDDRINQYLCGYKMVITSQNRTMVYKVSC